VSLLERLGRGHLGDSELARLWTAGGSHPHLDDCLECQVRFDDFSRWIAGVGDELRSDADHTMSSERLATQQAQIARRLEGLERPARVIAFPKAARAVISGNSHVRRWVTVAAAAGLIAGVGLGQMLDLHRGLTPGRVIPAEAPQLAASTVRADTLRPIAVSAKDDEILSDAESFARPRVDALVPLEDLTPHARDLMDRSR
jgi:hypothetical protein